MIRGRFGGKAARLAAGLMVASALAFAACGDDDDDEGSADTEAAETTEETTTDETGSAEEITVTATEYDFELSAQPTSETTKIVFDNQGEDPHAFVYGQINEGFTLDQAIKLQGRKGSATTLAEGGAGPGQTANILVKGGEVPPGEYVMLCPIEDQAGAHWKLGQLAEITIE